MKDKEIIKVLNKILKTEDSQIIGIIISNLSYHFLHMFDISEKEFYSKLKKTIKMLEGNKNEKII